MSTTSTENTTFSNFYVIEGSKISTTINNIISVTDTLLNDGTSIQDYEDFLGITDSQKESIF